MTSKPQQVVTGVLGLAVNDQGKFLITQRNEPEHSEVHRKWQIPGGGIEFGEQPEATLMREMDEELKLHPTIIYPYPMSKTSVWRYPEKDVSVMLLCFIVTIGQQIPRIGDPETLDYKWIHPSELYRLQYLALTDTFIDESVKICNRYSLWPRPAMVK